MMLRTSHETRENRHRTHEAILWFSWPREFDALGIQPPLRAATGKCSQHQAGNLSAGL